MLQPPNFKLPAPNLKPKDGAWYRSDTGPGFRTPGFGKSSNIVFLTIFGRTDLRISLSKAKIEPEADFDVRFAVARQIQAKLAKNENFDRKFSPKKVFRRRKTKRPESFETRFGKVSCRSEPCSRISRTPVSETPVPYPTEYLNTGWSLSHPTYRA